MHCFALILLLFVFKVKAEDWKPPVSTVNVKIGSPGHKSSKSKKSGVLEVKFGRSTVTGQYVNDIVSVDDINSPVDVGVLETANVDFYNLPVDGIIGISLDNYFRGGADEHESVVQSLLATSSKKWISIWTKQATSNADRISQVTFGGLNSKYCSGSPSFYPDSLDYQFNVEKLRFGTVRSHRTISSQVDFNEQFIRMPTTEFNQITNKLGVSADMKIQCSYIKNINLELKIGGIYYELTYEDYSQKIDNTYCVLLFKDNGGEYYSDGRGFVLGEPFLRKTCVTFDTQQTSIGFSTSINSK
ncbi:Eukaryotic aspartyl protease [Aphelenchoides bicaudatus]|nr:Eukaryotic aspartyl protease [Aphelenchoides bicaudatus]